MSESDKPGRPATPAARTSHNNVVMLAGVRQRMRVSPASAPPKQIVVVPEPAHNAAGEDESARASESGYAVGYGRPPKKTQFKKGQSGNSKGRPKAARNTRTMARDLLDRKLTVSINGKGKTVETREAVLHALLKKAVSGDAKAVERFFHIAGETFGVPQPGDADGTALNMPTAEELAILAFHYRERLSDEGLTTRQIATVLAMLGLPNDDPIAGDAFDGDEPADLNASSSSQRDKALEEEEEPI